MMDRYQALLADEKFQLRDIHADEEDFRTFYACNYGIEAGRTQQNVDKLESNSEPVLARRAQLLRS